MPSSAHFCHRGTARDAATSQPGSAAPAAPQAAIPAASQAAMSGPSCWEVSEREHAGRVREARDLIDGLRYDRRCIELGFHNPDCLKPFLDKELERTCTMSAGGSTRPPAGKSSRTRSRNGP